MAHLRPAITLIALFTLLTGLALPLGFVGLASVVVPWRAGGSMVVRNGTVVGSALIGQDWTSDRFLQGRPSATTRPDPADASKTVAAPYNAAASGGSNAGPTSQALIERVTAGVATLGGGTLGGGTVPGDAVTTSASGLDPHVSPAFAARQVTRIAAARSRPAAEIQALVDAHTEGRLFGILGEPRVDVLAVNLALDAG